MRQCTLVYEPNSRYHVSSFVWLQWWRCSITLLCSQFLTASSEMRGNMPYLLTSSSSALVYECYFNSREVCLQLPCLANVTTCEQLNMKVYMSLTVRYHASLSSFVCCSDDCWDHHSHLKIPQVLCVLTSYWSVTYLSCLHCNLLSLLL